MSYSYRGSHHGGSIANRGSTARRKGGSSPWRGGGGVSSKVTCSGRAQAQTPPTPLGPLLDSIISIKTLLTEEEAPTIEDVKYVASYNWLDGKSPIILIPGQ